ncbi:hypothetical protein LTR27_000926 [Elasticomyces elasticus]|nr:hypothetical protein LTR27_000926 [Elasticomyces elasticus]
MGACTHHADTTTSVKIVGRNLRGDETNFPTTKDRGEMLVAATPTATSARNLVFLRRTTVLSWARTATDDGFAKPKKSPDYSKPCHFFNTAVCTRPDCQFQHRKYQPGDAGYRGPFQKAGNARERDGTDDEFFDAEGGLDSEEEDDETA